MFFERFAVEQAGRAALIIAEGHLLPMYELFPGGIRFNVDEPERTKVDDAGESTETTTKKEQAGDDERPLLAIAVKRVDGDDGQATAFEIPELLVEHLLIYHKEEADAGETDDATIVGRREVTTRA